MEKKKNSIDIFLIFHWYFFICVKDIYVQWEKKKNIDILVLFMLKICQLSTIIPNFNIRFFSLKLCTIDFTIKFY